MAGPAIRKRPTDLGTLVNMPHAAEPSPRPAIIETGFRYPGNITPTAEWHAVVDPKAATEVFDGLTGALPLRRPVVPDRAA